jgi:hypothetical protein
MENWVDLILAFFGIYFFILVCEWSFRRISGGRRRMSEGQILADAFTEMVEDLLYRGMISEQKATWAYQKASLFLGLDGLLPLHLRGQALKAAIRHRLYNDTDFYRPVPLPDRKRSLGELLGKIPF